MSEERPAEVVLLTQFFPPETAAGARRAAAMTRALRSRALLRVATLEPGYPSPGLYPPERRGEADAAAGVPVTRARAFTPHDSSLLRRAWREIGMSLGLVRSARLAGARLVVVSTPSMFLAPVAWIAARAARAAFVWDVRDLTWRYAIERGGSPLQRFLLAAVEACMNAVLRRSDLVLAVTPGLALSLREAGVAPDRVLTVPNGVSRDFLERFRGVPPRPAPARPRITYVGLMGYTQGIGCLIDAARELPGTDWSLVGDGPERDALERRLRDSGTRNVTLHGYVTDAAELERLYRDSDVLVAHMLATPTLDRISYPSKTFEYLATGRPVVYAGSGAIAELLRSRDLAEVVPSGDPGALASAIRGVLEQPERAAARAARAREVTAAEFCREAQMDAFAEELAARFALSPPAAGVARVGA